VNPHLHSYLAQARTDELLRQAAERRRVELAPKRRSWLSSTVRAAAQRARGANHARPQSDASTVVDVRIRLAHHDDAAALSRLAELDSAVVPASPLLVAEIDGELRAALSLLDAGVIADPFHRTLALIELLRMRSAQLGRVQPDRSAGQPTRRFAGAARAQKAAR
jgi:hypothetical protein